MKRTLTYVLLFPLLCSICFLAIGGLPNVEELPAIIAIAYCLMIIPAVAIAAVDLMCVRALARILCTCTGFIMAPTVMYVMFAGPNRFGLYEVMFFGAIGGISAFGSWLIAANCAGTKHPEARNRGS